MSMREIVTVTITRETKSVSQVGFGTPLILGSSGNFTTRVATFTEVGQELADALVGGSNAPEYKAAVDMISQNPRVVSFKIGQINGERILTDDAGTWTAAGSVAVTINGTTVTQAFSTDKNTSMGALATQIAALSAVDTAVYSSGSHTITITPNTGYFLEITDITISGITGTMAAIVLTSNDTEDIVDALDDVVIEDDDWYGLCITSRTQADQEDVAEWTETKKKIFVLASAEPNIKNQTKTADTTSIAAVLRVASYDRSVVIYSAVAATEYPDAALLGKLLPYEPGTYTSKFKTLASITADALTGTQSTNIRDKNANSFELIGVNNIIREGKVSSGEFIDIIIFVDWIESRVVEGVYGVLVNNLKVPFTPSGMASIKGEIEKVLKIGQGRGGISDYSQDSNKLQNGGYIVTLPQYDLISTADKASRTLTDLKFTAWLTGAIHTVQINGIVTL